jgi:KipI family sensor histidine kinase inhibitor
MTARSCEWRWVGDRALLREFPAADLERANEAARNLYRVLLAQRCAEIEDVIPAARSVLVLLRCGAAATPALLSLLEEGGRAAEASRSEAALHEFEVGYGGEHGPDLAEVARIHGIDERTVVALHSSVTYTVAFLGFSPGFAYLIGLPAELATPRLATPRTRVPAGSVAIGGEFTAVYPRATPGGWRLIGHSEVSLFDVAADPPARLRPGDHVRFLPR